YADFLQEHLRAYRAGGIGDSRITAFLQRHLSENAVICVMHGMMNVWSPDDEAFSWFLVDDVEETDPLYEALIGYLINRNQFCLTNVHLLDRSYEERWPSWQVLWSKYF